MPRNIEEELELQEQRQRDLLAQRRAGLGGAFGNIRNRLTQERGTALTDIFGSRLASLGVGSGVSTAAGVQSGIQQGQLAGRLEGTLAGQEFGTSRGLLGTEFGRQEESKQFATTRRRGEEQFARLTHQDVLRRNQQAKMSEKERKNQLLRADMQSRAVQEGAQIQMQDTGQNEYQLALIRLFTSLPTQLLSFYGMSKGFGDTGSASRTDITAGAGDVSKSIYNPEIYGLSAGTSGRTAGAR